MSISHITLVESFKLACDAGRGAILLVSARGKIATESIFYDHYCRAAVVFGVPYSDIMSRALRARLLYIQSHNGIDKREFFNFDAMRVAV